MAVNRLIHVDYALLLFNNVRITGQLMGVVRHYSFNVYFILDFYPFDNRHRSSCIPQKNVNFPYY